MVHVCDWFSSLLHHQSMILRRCLLSDPNYSDIPIFCSFNNRNRESAKALLESDLSFNLLCVSGLGIEGSPITLVVTKSWLGNNTDFCSKSFLLTHEILQLWLMQISAVTCAHLHLEEPLIFALIDDCRYPHLHLEAFNTIPHAWLMQWLEASRVHRYAMGKLCTL